MAKTVLESLHQVLKIIKNGNFQTYFLLDILKLFYSIILQEVGLHFPSLDDEVLTTLLFTKS